MNEVTLHDQLLAELSDLYKEVYGIRPRGMYNDYTVSQLEVEIEHLVQQAKYEHEQEIIRQNESAAKFEKKISELITMGAGDRSTAIRWLCDVNIDREMMEYEFDLPYGYLKEA